MRKIILSENQYKYICESVNTHNVLNNVYVTFGTEEYKRGLTKPIKQDHWSYSVNKPNGGLWASPIDSKNGWMDWASENHFNLRSFDKHFCFRLKPDAKIYVINNEEDLDNLTQYNVNSVYGPIDWERLAKKGYDGVFATYTAIKELRNRYRNLIDLYSWDVESICVFNENVIIPLDENEFDKLEIYLKAFRKIQSNAYTRDDVKNHSFFSNTFTKEDKEEEYMEKLYGNRNKYHFNNDMFNGKHPGILAQGDENDKNTIQARNFSGTLKKI